MLTPTQDIDTSNVRVACIELAMTDMLRFRGSYFPTYASSHFLLLLSWPQVRLLWAHAAAAGWIKLLNFEVKTA